MKAESKHYPVRLMCKVLGLRPSGYYAWLNRPRNINKIQSDQEVLAEILKIDKEVDKVYGVPRMTKELRARGFEINHKRVERIMRKNGIQGIPARKFKITTDSGHKFPVAPNLLNQEFDVAKPNQVWAADITYISTGEGWMYLGVVMDLYSRKIVGWSMDRHMETSLVSNALQMAIGMRDVKDGLIHHSDRGSQYASNDYQQALRENKIKVSMSKRACCYDNAVVESFFGSLKQELVYRRRFATRAAARVAVEDYIEVFYNRIRRHSTLGFLSPANFESLYPAGNAA
jgi:putative transposase